ncbi:molybdenum cofactor guanylyltransferase MobA [Amylibacter kogurei]|uniref:Molybdenum cofactor guanylyltransferase n=1 Tax=Paramylibacter kogurei TaxID=1889778 RepID=A0A2G5K108_9RHOB|nr:molybdenum cofactor guanylyltransferase MobA [Amylibacter kogurei]PIB23217.1 molybdenum cofactor guanylyltransferase MobA [Amylibacter kogurei]
MLGVILAGGQSTRMGGGDKCLRMLGAQPLLQHVIDRLEPQVDGIALNANGDASRFANFNLPVIADSIADFAGPLAGVLAGLDWAASQGAKHIVTVAADTPFFPNDLVARLQDGLGEHTLAMAMGCDENPRFARHPTFGIWPVALRQNLRHALANDIRKVVQWTSQHDCVGVVFDDTHFDPFFNVNTPDDMSAAERMYQEYFA